MLTNGMVMVGDIVRLSDIWGIRNGGHDGQVIGVVPNASMNGEDYIILKMDPEWSKICPDDETTFFEVSDIEMVIFHPLDPNAENDPTMWGNWIGQQIERAAEAMYAPKS